MAKPKVGIIGAGNVGATCAQRILERDIADVALVDVVAGLAAGKALDLAQAAVLEGHDGKIVGSHEYTGLQGAQIVVITAGMARKPGMTREDLLEANAKIVHSIVPRVMSQAPEAILILVSNPLDAMAYLASQMTKWGPRRVFGMAGVLDSARLRCFVAEKLKVSVKEVQGLVLGGHGDTMVPVPEMTTVAGVPITKLLPKEEVEQLIERTRKGGAEIVGLLKTGSAFYAPASSTADMVQAILLNENRILPVCAWLTGQYGLDKVYCGVPARLGQGGLREVVEIPLSDAAKKSLNQSADAVRKEMKAIDAFLNAAA